MGGGGHAACIICTALQLEAHAGDDLCRRLGLTSAVICIQYGLLWGRRATTVIVPPSLVGFASEVVGTNDRSQSGRGRTVQEHHR